VAANKWNVIAKRRGVGEMALPKSSSTWNAKPTSPKRTQGGQALWMRRKVQGTKPVLMKEHIRERKQRICPQIKVELKNTNGI